MLTNPQSQPTTNPSTDNLTEPIEKVEICPKCGIKRVDGIFRWSHQNKPVAAINVAGLVCNLKDHPECINPAKGKTCGETWQERLTKLPEQADML